MMEVFMKVFFPSTKFILGNYYYGELRGLGRFISCLGHIYEGYFANSKPHGQGKEIWPDGSIFTGEFSAGFKKRG
jgi:hypothetical protein